MSRQPCSRTAVDCGLPLGGTARAVVSFTFGLICTSGLPPYITGPFGGGTGPFGGGLLLWPHAAVAQSMAVASTTNVLMSPYPVFRLRGPSRALSRTLRERQLNWNRGKSNNPPFASKSSLGLRLAGQK